MITDLTLLTCNYNTNDLLLTMLKTFFCNIQQLIPIIIVDNSDREPISKLCKTLFTVIDNTNYQITGNYNQPSKNHSASIDYALKNLIETKYCLLCDTDIIFKGDIDKFIEYRHDYNVIGTIQETGVPPERIVPFCCLIDIKKFKDDNINYYDPKRCIKNAVSGIITNGYEYDTGASFYEDIKDSWKIKNITNTSDYYEHIGHGSFSNFKY